ncbi:unnamed protein product, partial [Rhizophagus irregularis]
AKNNCEVYECEDKSLGEDKEKDTESYLNVNIDD